MSSETTFVRSDPSMLITEVTDVELSYRSGLGFNDENIIKEKIRCTSCDKPLKNVFTDFKVAFHPTFQVIICEDCEDFYETGEFSVDEDGSDKYCRWCGQGGSLYCCSKCSIAICEKCVKRNFAKSYLSEIEDDEWKCFICDSKPIWPHRAQAAALREYIETHKPKKIKRRKSDDFDDDQHKSKRARNESSGKEDESDNTVKPRRSKASLKAYADDSYDEKSKKEEKSNNKSSSSRSPRKRSSKSVINISDDEEEDDRRSKSRKSNKNNSVGSETGDDSTDLEKKSRRGSRKSKGDNNIMDENAENKARSKSRRSEDHRDKNTSRRSKKIISDKEDGTESDKSVFRDKNDSRRNSRKSRTSSDNSASSRQKSTSTDNVDPKDADAIRLFQHVLKGSMNDFDKFLKIINDRKNTFRDKYVTNRKHLRCLDDVAVAKEKFIAFLNNMMNSTKRIETTFVSSVEPLISDVASAKRAAAVARKDASAAESSDNLLKSVVDESISKRKGSKDDAAEQEQEEGSQSNSDDYAIKMDVDDDDGLVKDKTSAEETQNEELVADSDSEATAASTPVADKSKVSPKKDGIDVTDNGNETNISLTEDENGKKAANESSLTNDVHPSAAETEDDDSIIGGDTGVSDSMIVNLGTEDESAVTLNDASVLSSKEKSAKLDLLAMSDTETSSGDERKAAACNSTATGGGGNSKTANTDDGKSDDSDEDQHSISKEELAKKDLLKSSDADSETDVNKPASLSRDVVAQANAESESLKQEQHPSQDDETTNKNNANGKYADDADSSAVINTSKSKEIQAKKDLLQSPYSSANEQLGNSDLSSDSAMSGVESLSKNKEETKPRQKRRTKRLSDVLEARQSKDSDEEDREINRLVNLKTLKKKKVRATLDDSDEETVNSEKENQDVENKNMKSSPRKNIKNPLPRKSLQDYMSDGTDNQDTAENDDNDDDEDDPFREFNNFLDEKKNKMSLLTQNDLCKQQLLDSSDSDKENELDSDDDLIFPSKPEKPKKISKNADSKKAKNVQTSESDDESVSENNSKKKKSASWRNDRLLRSKLSTSDTSDDEKIAARFRRREAESKKKKKDDWSNSSDSEDIFRTKPPASGKKKKKVKSSSDNSSSDSVQIVENVESKSRKKRSRIKKLWSDTDESDECESSQNTQGSASKGRKNIRKVMKDEELTEETKITAKQEEMRKKRISERQSLFNEVFQVVDVESEIPKKLVLDFDAETKTELVSVHPDVVKKLKPHQVKGIKFMWDSCFESIAQIEKNRGGGCILAHCMGLGKTLQVIALVHTVLRYPATTVKKVLIICPVSTILNWVSEFKMWLDGLEGDDDDIDVWHFNKLQKTNKERAYLLRKWASDGGVMIIGYDKFRALVNNKNVTTKWKDVIHETLLNPGPDLVICDEGHTLKNEKSAISVATMKISTRRRIVLTGTPLQNNLNEYHCMVQFVKPNLLGDKKEFQNRFSNPITNGQFTNSTQHDVRLMKRRSHVLHKMLDGIIQRFDYNVLTPFLPPKHEFVISVALSDLQATLYEHYVTTYSRVSMNGENRSLFKDYQIMRLIWTHPFAMNKGFEKQMKLQAAKEEEEDSMDDFIVSGSDDNSSSAEDSDASIINLEGSDEDKPKKRNYKTRAKRDADPADDAAPEPELEIDPKAGAWWRPFITDEDIDNYKQGPKLILLFAILRECELIGDKVLVFSQSIPSLDMIEHFLKKTNEISHYGSMLDAEGDADYLGTWRKHVDYFRLDGSTPSELRTEYTNKFNQPSNTRARLFLISTRAGGLGINLTAANRVIIFDASWNPSHDVQSIFRVYRFGQKKPCYIYRFLSQGTMEEKIYERQVTKLSISCRVVDEQQIDRHFSRNEVEELYTFNRKTPSEDEIPKLPSDRLMAEILKAYKNMIISYHEHDSLLENIVDEELTEEERKQAWEEYENDKLPKAPVQMPFRSEMYHNISDETILNSIKLQNPNATPEMLEDMKKKVRLRIMQYYAEQQRVMQMQQPRMQNIPIAQKRDLDMQMEINRRAFAYNAEVQKSRNLHNGNAGSSRPEP